jgi:uncharacterized protein
VSDPSATQSVPTQSIPAQSIPSSRIPQQSPQPVSNLTIVMLVAIVIALILATVALTRQTTLNSAVRTSGDASDPSAAAPVALSSSSYGSYGSRSISTEGTAVRRVAPDLATITLFVKTRTTSPADSQRTNDEMQRAVIAAVRKAGIDPKQINPSGLDISEEERTVDEIRIVEYIVQTEVHIETKDLKNISQVLQQAFAAGATTGRVEFKTSRLRELRDLARKDAVKAARDKARDLTEGVDATVGKVISISEGTFGYYAPTQNSVRDNRQVETSAPSTDGDGSMEDQFGGGLISISASVSASFEMN